MSHSVTVTRTVTSNTTSALVVNTGYLKTLPGLLKLAQLVRFFFTILPLTSLSNRNKSICILNGENIGRNLSFCTKIHTFICFVSGLAFIGTSFKASVIPKPCIIAAFIWTLFQIQKNDLFSLLYFPIFVVIIFVDPWSSLYWYYCTLSWSLHLASLFCARYFLSYDGDDFFHWDILSTGLLFVLAQHWWHHLENHLCKYRFVLFFLVFEMITE